MAILSRSADRMVIVHDLVCGNATRISSPPLLPDAVWLGGRGRGDGLEYRFAKGALADFSWLAADFLLEGRQTAVFRLSLFASDGRECTLSFAILNQCQARLRMPLAITRQNTWLLGREGAMLKRVCGGDPVDLREVDRMTLTLQRHGSKEVRWCMTSLQASPGEPARLENPLLPAGPLLDAIGQSTLHDWSERTQSGVELHHRLQEQLTAAHNLNGNAGKAHASSGPGLSRWGGWKGKTFKKTGMFHVEHDGRRWWLVDPDGWAFWSAGSESVGMNLDSTVEGIGQAARWLPAKQGPFGAAWDMQKASASFLVANFVRVFGEEYHRTWSTITLSNLRQVGFNSIGQGSDWKLARSAGLGYVRTLEFKPEQTAFIFRDFPDVFASTFEADAIAHARPLAEHAGDQCLLGYFLLNPPAWACATQTPAEGMLFNTESCATRNEFALWLERKYGAGPGLAEAWKHPVTLEEIRSGRWTARPGPQARPDLEQFSALMVEKLFATLSRACRKVDADHLNLGARCHGLPPRWMLNAMKSFDVVTISYHKPRVAAADLKLIEQITGRPTLICPWHFGALDAGLPASGSGLVANQHDRGRAYRIFLEQAAAIPQCIGAHWGSWYDQSALGRLDGENYNIGFFDVCNRPYQALCSAAQQSHARIYEVAAGKLKAFDNAPAYFPAVYV